MLCIHLPCDFGDLDCFPSGLFFAFGLFTECRLPEALHRPPPRFRLLVPLILIFVVVHVTTKFEVEVICGTTEGKASPKT